MNKREFEKAMAEVAERLDLYLGQRVEAGMEVGKERRGGG